MTGIKTIIGLNQHLPMKKTVSILTLSVLTAALAFLMINGLTGGKQNTPSVSLVTNSPEEVEGTEISMMEAIRRDMEAQEYYIRFQESAGALQSPNRAQNLRFSYHPDGFSMKTRMDSLGTENWEVSMKVAGIYRGRTRKLTPEQNPEQEIKYNHLQYHHDGGLTIEYKNDLAGMRQNFILETRPEGEGPLAVAMELETELEPLLSSEKELVFTELTPEQTLENKVRYKDLKVFDANGKEMPARMMLQENMLALVVNDQNATYPLTIDPLSTTADATVESNQASAYFGTSVSGAGDVNGDGFSDIVVAAPFYDNGEADEGGILVYHGSQSGISTTASTFIESNQASARIGNSVSGAGDVNGDGYADIIVGGELYDNGETDEGAAFVYHGSASGISSTPAATVESNQANAWFGGAVSGAGDVNGDGYSDVVVGARFYDNGESNEGMIFVYHGSALGISTTPATIAESNLNSANLGRSVCNAGDINGDGYSDIISGASEYSSGQNSEGAIYVYHGSGAGISTTPAVIYESNQAFARLGEAVNGAGDVNGDGYSDVIAGAKYYDNGESDEGVAIVYLGSAAGLGAASTTLESNLTNTYLGSSVASAGDVNGDGYSDIIVGATGFTNGESSEGAAFVYYGSASGVSTTAAATFESNQTVAFMGVSVSSAGDVNGDGFSDVLIGAQGYDNGQSDEGLAFVYHGSADGLSITAASQWEINQAEAAFGYSVSNAGDVNGDGYDDVIIGSNFVDLGQVNEGAAFIYHGSPTGASLTSAVVLERNQAYAYMGRQVSTAGDVNGDGYDDVIIGANEYDNGQLDEGAAFVYHGSSSGVSNTVAAQLEANQAQAYFGTSVSTAGDVNGDGYSDVIVGARYYDNGSFNEGAAFVYHGSASGVSTTPAAQLENNQASADFGYSVSSAGDVNGDGYSDVIVGSSAYDNSLSDQGAAFFYYGSSSGIPTVAGTIIEGDQATAYFGESVSSAGDVNGDGYSDVIIGQSWYDNGHTDEGAASVYHGGAAGISTIASTFLESNQANARLGMSVSSAGDVNGDGYSDVIVGAPYYDNGQTDEGIALIYHGSSSGVSTTASALLENDNWSGGLGTSVSYAGDVNGDGYCDVIVGGPWYDNGELNEGIAHVYHGNADGNMTRYTRAYRPDLTTPLGAAGGPGSESQFGIGHFARTMQGRQDVKLVWECVGEGESFSGSPVASGVAYTGQSASWTDIGTVGTEIKELVNKLTTSKRTVWRARLQYSQLSSINGQVYGPWVYGPRVANASAPGAFPVEWGYWEATWQEAGRSALLEWETQSESNNDRFEIERSFDGNAFEQVGTVDGFGTTTTPKDYRFVDTAFDHIPSDAKEVFYRLKQIDLDGQHNFSEVRILALPADEGALDIWPNPASTSVNMQYHVATTGYRLEVIDLTGRIVYTTQLTNLADRFSVNVSGFKAGLYFVHLTNGRERITKKVVVRN